MLFFIKQIGHIINFRGKDYRTPIKLSVNSREVEKLEKIMKYKCINDYEIIDKNEKIDHIGNNVKSIDSMNRNFYSISPHTDIQNKSKNTTVVKSITSFDSSIDENDFYESITDEADSDIQIDENSDNILQQLLKNI